MEPTSLVMFLNGEYELHYEGVSEAHYMEGYWPAVHFSADGTPIDTYIEA